MNFTCSRKDLVFGIKTAGRALGSASTLPILAGMRLDMQENTLVLHATDLESAIRCRVPLENPVDAHSVVLNGDVLSRMVGVLPAESVKFEQASNSNKVEVSCGGTTFDLFTLPLEDYPQLSELPASPFVTLDKALLQRGIDLTTFGALSAKETSRLSLTGVDLLFEKDRLRMVATNGYRLAVYEIPLQDGPEGEYLVDAGALRDLGGVLGQLDADRVEVYQEGGQLFFHTPQVTTTLRVMEEEYPDVDRVIPKNNPIGLELDRGALLAALQRAQITTAEESGAVVLQAQEGKLHLSSSSSEKGETEETLKLDKPVDEVRISFKAEYLIEALKRMDSDRVKLWLADSESAGLLEPAGEGGHDDGFIYVCMPIRLDL